MRIHCPMSSTFPLGWQLIAVVAGWLLSGAGSALAQDDTEFFEQKIRPVLVTHCYECHSADAKKLGGKLLLDSRDGVQLGGDSGPAIESGSPDTSLLIKAVRYKDDASNMPPQGKLPDQAIADLEEWVRRGAPDPRDKPVTRAAGASWEEQFRERSAWWSLQPVQSPSVPTPKHADWSGDAIDRFILAKLEEQGLQPVEPADPHTLIRRLSLVLTGLPPTPEHVAGVLREIERERAAASQLVGEADRHVCPPVETPEASISRYVDTLLVSPHFGERWARHWMDVVRFTETHGNEWNYEVHHAWRYRDYLIRAFNSDVPYDRFVREHIAGDLLAQPRWNAAERINESLIGTSFYRFGEVNHDDCIALRELGYDILDNQIDTATKAFQGMTVACARCHDHKFDAISTKDYYALLGVLRSSRFVAQTIDSPVVNAEPIERLKGIKQTLRGELAALWSTQSQEAGRYLSAAISKQIAGLDAESSAEGLDPARVDKWVAALAAEKQPFEEAFEPLRAALRAIHPAAPVAAADGTTPPATEPQTAANAWSAVVQQYTADDKSRTEFNQSQFETYADFRIGLPTGWDAGGHGLREPMTPSGELVIAAEGDRIVRSILPAGCFTFTTSDRLNGTLRSRVIPNGKQRISFGLVGERSSAVRLVSNNCQLNYQNYRALTNPQFSWVTFTLPDDREQLRTYVELMTMWDNPKFPDQLSALGGDPANYKVPWEKAIENPRSYFGITQVVLHDCGESPKLELGHLRPLLASEPVTTVSELALRYERAICDSVQRWVEKQPTAEDVVWMNTLLKYGLIGNELGATPQAATLSAEFRRIEATLAAPRIVPGLADVDAGADQAVFIRGDCRIPGPVAPRQFLVSLAAFNPPELAALPPGSGRLAVAEQLASSRNPLTARVMVNRVWHHLFGTGLVRTVDDFGHVGELPSHPELLDHLASEFMADGWSVKRLIRRIVLSRTFQLASHAGPSATEVDPQNRWLSHFPARRLEAEAIRDATLACSGRLDPQLYGLSIQPFREKEYADRRLFPGPLDGNGRRSVYIKNNLMEGPKFLEAFNFPGGKVTQGRRDVSNTPAQALALLNDPFVLQQADVWASRLVTRTSDTLDSRIDFMLETALSRHPSAEERVAFAQVAVQLAELHQLPTGELLLSHAVWKDIAHAVFNQQEFIYVP